MNKTQQRRHSTPYMDAIAEDETDCPTCHAKRGERCETKSGMPTQPHQPRIDRALEPWMRK